MILTAYIRVSDKSEVEQAESIGLSTDNLPSSRMERVAIRLDCVESINPNTSIHPDDDSVDVCVTDIYLTSGEHWLIYAQYEDVLKIWIDSLSAPGRTVVNIKPTLMELS